MKSHLAAIVSLVASASGAQAQKDSVLSYETTIRSSAMFGMAGESVVRMRIVESSLGIRQELIERIGPRSGSKAAGLFKHPGSYSLRLASGAMVLVDPEAREYSSFGDLITDAGNDTTQLLKSIESFAGKVDSKSTSEVDSIGNGEMIAGQPTSHWRIHDVMKMTIKGNSDSVVTGSDLTTETYIAQSIPRLAPEGTWEPGYGSEARKKLPPRLELKSITRGTMALPGMAMPVQVIREVTQVSKSPLDRALFEVPKDYKKVEMQFPASPPGNF